MDIQVNISLNVKKVKVRIMRADEVIRFALEFYINEEILPTITINLDELQLVKIKEELEKALKKAYGEERI